MVRLRVCRRGALPDGGAAGVKAVELPEGVKGWADGRLASFLANTAGVAEPCRVSVRYADGVCKQGQHPFGGMITDLQSEGRLPASWQCVAALPTYNPLGSTATFLNAPDIVEACNKCFSSH